MDSIRRCPYSKSKRLTFDRHTVIHPFVLSTFVRVFTSVNSALEVMHFSRDAQLAEEWIVKEELNLVGKDRGVCTSSPAPSS